MVEVLSRRKRRMKEEACRFVPEMIRNVAWVRLVRGKDWGRGKEEASP